MTSTTETLRSTKVSEIRVKGRAITVPSVEVDEKTVVTTGKWLKVAAVREEELVEGETVRDPEAFISCLKRSGLKADLFTFGQRIPNVEPKHGNYFIEWENAAAIPITTFSEWWKEGIEYSIRKAVNRSKKLGVIVRPVEFSEEFVRAAHLIYNETPVRQGKAFWHYGKDLQTITRELATYLDRSMFIGAYFEDNLIGFIKLSFVDGTATITQILSLTKHFEKRPNNALIAKAVEICADLGKTHFIYGSFVYYDPNSSLTEFKRRNGFQQIELPRYYIPLTLKGALALKCRMHRGLAGNLPPAVLSALLKLRARWCDIRLRGPARHAMPEREPEGRA
jgi:hypothetical protein